MFISDEKNKKISKRYTRNFSSGDGRCSVCTSSISREFRLDSFRVISDGGDERAHDEFNHFLEKYKLNLLI